MPGEGGEARYILDEQVGYLLRLASQRHAALFQARTVEGLTPTQFAALIRLSQHEAVSQNHLGRLTGMDVATIKGVVDRLKAKDLVTLAADPDDRRRTLIALSERGRALIPDLEAMGAAVTADTLAPLTRAEARAFRRLLEKLT